MNSNPRIRADRYRITAVDSCGNESDPSPHHKTIHLTASKGTSNENNLIWNHYEGFPFNSYYLYRGTSPSNMAIFDTFPSTSNSMSDLNPPSGLVFYQISAVKLDTCYPTIIRGVTSSGPYSQAFSNLRDYSNAQEFYLSINPSSIILDSNAGSSDTINIYTNSQYWAAITNDDWIELTPNVTDGSLIVTAFTENTQSEHRSGTIIVSCDGVNNQILTVEQKGKWNNVSINESTANGILKVYPNPFNQSTHIILPNNETFIKKLELYDISGKLARTVENISSNQYELHKGNLSEGLYFVRVIADRIYFEKVVVE